MKSQLYLTLRKPTLIALAWAFLYFGVVMLKRIIPQWFLTYPGLWVANWTSSLGIQSFLLKAQQVGQLCWLGATLLVLIDFILAGDKQTGNTWSELMRSYGQRQLVLPWLCGVLIGHLFHPQDKLFPRGGLNLKESHNLIFWLTALLGLAGGLAQWRLINVPEILMTVMVILGCVVGCLIWPIERKTKDWSTPS